MDLPGHTSVQCFSMCSMELEPKVGSGVRVKSFNQLRLPEANHTKNESYPVRLSVRKCEVERSENYLPCSPKRYQCLAERCLGPGRAPRMALIEGVGDEVTLLFGVLFLALVLVLAWASTHTADRSQHLFAPPGSAASHRTTPSQESASPEPLPPECPRRAWAGRSARTSPPGRRDRRERGV
ncbi:hypothetical protein AAFF_G00122070 [Aldrovandia affinis]|uniref:Uncharacterized protein n=1 Tax=Aldrovandia affinis TaxID=143900 RepID=A0AAD7W9T8_9TELE|nr:hypothetical protein AAFF_G00122070 [Aldrovandia affinis]